MRSQHQGSSPVATRTAQWWRTAGALGVTLVFLPLLALMVAGSLHDPSRPPPPTPDIVPDPFSAAGYEQAIALGGLARATLNSLLVALVAVPVSVLVASLAGFAMTLLSARLTRLVAATAMLALMVPATALLVPRFAIFRGLGLTDTLAPLAAPALVAGSPLYVLVYYVAFRSLSPDLYDACRLEDMTPRQVWWRVAMPMVRRVTAGVAALTFLLSWSNVLDPLVYVYRRELFTLPLALRSLATLDPANFPVLLAGAVLATAPALIVIVLAQRHYLGHEERTG